MCIHARLSSLSLREILEIGPAQGTPRPQAFFKMGGPGRHSGIPGDLDRGDGLLKWRGCLETISSALNSSGPCKSFTGGGHGSLRTEVWESDS